MKQIEEAKMVGYKLPKNDWVTPFFVIFRSVREKLLVTVFSDHPVSILITLTSASFEEHWKYIQFIKLDSYNSNWVK